MHYRPEIDGLRAVAVVPVILFHAGIEPFSGGFIGVDVFFVISGYLITTILINDLEGGRFSLLKFYERRARRILPALFFVIAVCVPLAWVWMRPAQFDDFANSLIAVSLFASNILFWRESGYFAPAAELKPLLHTWSLAVEEQYYLLFPIFLVLAWRFGRRPVFWMIVGFSAISLLLAEWGWRTAPSANFYLLPTRAWELLAGSLAAFIVTKSGVRPHQGLAFAGLVAVLVPVFWYDEFTPFPSLYTLVPVLGTVALILWCGGQTWVGRALSWRPVVGIGLISYSAYLWHQPVFAFARIRLLFEPTGMVMLGLSLMSLVLAALSWRLIEQPFRGKTPFLPRQTQIFSFALVGMGALVTLGALASNQSAYEARLTPEQRQVLTYLDYSETQEFVDLNRVPMCFLDKQPQAFDLFRPDLCLKTDADRPNILLLGDSHAAHLWGALAQTYPQVNVMQANASECPPLLPYRGARACRALLAYLWEEWLPQNAGGLDAVIVSSRWQAWDMADVAPTIAALQEVADQVIVFGPMVEYHTDVPVLLAHSLNSATPDVFAARHLDPARFEVARLLATEVAKTSARYVDTQGLLCRPTQEGQTCPVQADDGTPMAFDYGHFTFSGARHFITQIDDLLDLKP